MIARFLLATALALYGAVGLAAESWKLVLKPDGTVDQTNSTLPEHGKTAHVSSDGITLTIACETQADCDASNFEVRKGEGAGTAIKPSNTTAAKVRTYAVSVSPTAPEPLKVSWKKKVIFSEAARADGNSSEVTPPVAGAVQGTRLIDFLQLNCARENTTGWQEWERDADDKNTKVTVSSAGDVLGDALQNVSEDDSVTVQVVAEPDLLRFIRVVRKSPIRVTGGVTIVGADVTLPIARKTSKRCEAKTFTVRDFAGGTGVIEIQAITSQGPVPLGRLEFPVNRLYSGMFTVGPVWSWAVDHDVGLVANGANQVLTETEKARTRVLWALFFTPFVWGKRDIERPIPLLHRFNPSLGLVLNDVSQHALAGVSFDFLSGFVLCGGYHWAHVTVVDPRSGLAEGSVYTGDPSKLPIARKWIHDWFVGVTIDVRAAVQFLKTAGSATLQ